MLLKFSLILISSCLLATSVLAHPYPQLGVPGTDNDLSHWAGVEVLGEANGIFTEVNAAFVIPSIKEYGSPFSIQTGFDGQRCHNVSLYAGVEVTPNKDGQASHKAWYQWLPDIERHYLDWNISTDDRIQVHISSPAEGQGTVAIANLNTGEDFSRTLESWKNPICGRDLSFVVEPQQSDTPIANFDVIVFASVYDLYGNTNKSSEIKQVDLVQDGQITAQASFVMGVYVVEYVAK